MALVDTLHKASAEGDVDLLREGVRLLAQAFMEAEVSELTGVAKGERDPERRLTHRNGYRDRRWDTRVGTIELAIPRVRDGSYLPSLLEPDSSMSATTPARRADPIATARSAPTGSSRPARTSAGARSSPSRPQSGSMAPWPAPRRQFASPTARFRNRARRTRSRVVADRRAWLAKKRLRLPRGDEGLEPIPFEQCRQRLVPFLSTLSLNRVRDPAGRALEDESSNAARMVQGEPERDARSERRADDVGRRRADVRQQRGEIRGDARERVPARIGRSIGAAVSGQVDDDRAAAPTQCRQMLPPARHSSREPVEQQDRETVTGHPHLESDVVHEDASHRGAHDVGGARSRRASAIAARQA